MRTDVLEFNVETSVSNALVFDFSTYCCVTAHFLCSSVNRLGHLLPPGIYKTSLTPLLLVNRHPASKSPPFLML